MVEESSKIGHNEPLNYHSKGFVRWGFWSNIALVAYLSISIMSLAIMLAVPIFASMAIFMGAIYGLIHLLTGKMTYTLDQSGVHHKIHPNLKWFKPSTVFYPWENIVSYERGTDLNRSKKEYNYIYIQVIKPSRTLRISDDKGNKEVLASWADQFESYVNGDVPVEHSEVSSEDPQNNTESPSKTVVTTDQVGDSVKKGLPIKKKRSFYQKPIAKVITIGFIVISGFLLNHNLQNGMSETNLFRLNVIIIPGTLYLIYRVFYQKK